MLTRTLKLRPGRQPAHNQKQQDLIGSVENAVRDRARQRSQHAGIFVFPLTAETKAKHPEQLGTTVVEKTSRAPSWKVNFQDGKQTEHLR